MIYINKTFSMNVTLIAIVLYYYNIKNSFIMKICYILFIHIFINNLCLLKWLIKYLEILSIIKYCL